MIGMAQASAARCSVSSRALKPADAKRRHDGKIPVGRFRLGPAAPLDQRLIGVVLRRDLFLIDRRHHHRRRTGILQPADPVEVAGERRRRGDDRVRELQSEIVGFEVHGRPPQALSQLGRNRLPSRAARSS